MDAWEVWFADETRDEARTVNAYSSDEAASEFVEECDLDSETQETDVCVAPVGSDEIETFTLTSEYSRSWYAARWPDPLHRFGNVLAEIAQWIAKEAAFKESLAKRHAIRAEIEERRAQREALALLSRLGCVIGAALVARDELRVLGFADDTHERVFAAHLALRKTGLNVTTAGGAR